VDLPKAMDSLKQIAIREGVKPAEQGIADFHASFIEEIRTSGRIHEVSLIGRYKRRTKQWFQDMRLGLEMFKRGRLKLLPKKVRDRKKVEEIVRIRVT
jgi:heterodisulfide reductase subunit C/quinone-modifying oxidoreductase subunit QmoC